MALVRVARVDEIAPGTGTVVRAGTVAVALFNLGGAWHAINNRCTHVGGPLGEGRVEGKVVTCPLHGSRFDVETGAVLGPPARRPVETYSVSIQDQDVFVEIP